MDKVKPKQDKKVYEVEDAEFLLIQAIQELANQIRKLRERL